MCCDLLVIILFGMYAYNYSILFAQESCSPQEKENFLKEIVVMAQFMHPNIVRVFGSVDQGISFVCTDH